MAKAKGKGQNTQSHIQARIAYLSNAATLLQAAATPANAKKITSEKKPEFDNQNDTASSKQPMPSQEEEKEEEHDEQQQQLPTPIPKQKGQISYLARQYTAQFRAISLKSLLRLDRQTKRSVCKRCDTMLIPGSTCWEVVENKSRGKKKPWADVRVVRCGFCGTPKRYPLQASRRSLKLVERRKARSEVKDETTANAG